MPLRTPQGITSRSAQHDLTRALAANLLRGQRAALFAHVVLIFPVVTFLWGVVPTPQLVGWVAALALAVAARAAALKHAAKREVPPEAVIRQLRLLVAGSGLAWGLGAGLLTTDLLPRYWALLLVLMSGFGATAAATLQADPVAFRLFLGTTLGPMAIGILADGRDREHLFALFLILFFTGFVTMLNRRLYRMLVRHMRAGVRLERSERRVRREHAFLDALFDGAPVGIAVVGPDGRVRGVNPRFEALFGYPAAEAVGQSLNELIVPPGGLAGAQSLDEQVRAGHSLVTEVDRRRRDGQVVPVRLSASQVADAGDGSTFAVYEDITVSRRAAEALVAARDAAEQSARARSAFLANMSHEIRTPMNAVLGLTELLLDGELPAEQRRQVQLVHGAADGLLTILNDILDFSKIEGAYLTLEEIPFDLPGLIHATVRLLAVRATERGVELVSDIAPGVPAAVRGDPGRLRQVLTNLIGNAIKFTHEGEITVTVSAADEPGDRVLVTCVVQDTGIGIPQEKFGAIFEAFSQADVSTTRKYGGTGLGLAISQRLVRLMGGEITVTSQPGKGSAFAFTVPLGRDAGSRVAATPRLDLAGVRALVVDDNATNRRIVGEALHDAGVVVTEATRADQALAELRRAHGTGAPYGLVVIDGQMPERDGFALAADVLGDTALAASRLLMLTSGGTRGDGKRCRDLGIRGYLTKPVSRAELLEAAAAVLGGGGATTEIVTRHSLAEARRSLRLLLAEDNPINQEVAAAILRKRGHRVDIVGTGRLAVDAVAHTPYDLVLMDIQMPELDGLTATREIRGTPAGREVVIVALTAHASGVERDRCLAAGMNGYLTKPFRPHELFALIEGLAPPSEASAAAPVDLAAFRTTMREAGAEDAVDGIVAMFAQTAPGRVAALTAAVEAGDAAAVAKTAHAFRSAAATIGARALADLLADAERAGNDAAVEQARALLPDLRGEVEALLQYLQREVTRAHPDR